MCQIANTHLSVMDRLLERSHPKIAEMKYSYRTKSSCKVCGSKKHSTVQHDKSVTFDSYDLLVHDILMDVASFA